MTAAAGRRAVRYASALTFVVATLAGVLATLVGIALWPGGDPLVEAASRPEPWVAHVVLDLFYWAVVVGLAVLPAAGTAHRMTYGDQHPAGYLMLGAGSMLVLPGVLLLPPVPVLTRLTAEATRLLNALLVGLGCLLVVDAWTGDGRLPGSGGVPWPIFANLWLLTVVLLGLALGGAIGAEASGLVEREAAAFPLVAFGPADGPTSDTAGSIVTASTGPHAGERGFLPGPPSSAGQLPVHCSNKPLVQLDYNATDISSGY